MEWNKEIDSLDSGESPNNLKIGSNEELYGN